MTQCHIPTCYFPSTTLFVDDSKDFLVNFSLQLPENLAYQIYDSPYTALKALRVGGNAEQIHQRCVSEKFDADGNPLTHQGYDIDLSAIHFEVYNPQRFAEVSVVVVDYAMPGLNGIEFCRHLSASPVRKILLTGRADEKMAIAAFNDGLIDGFVQKNDPDVIPLINANIKRLQQAYFRSMSDLIVRMLSMSGLHCLQDKGFAEFFDKLCAKHQIVEYYLTENTGSFLLLDADGQISCLVVKNQADLQHYSELAMDNNADDHMVEQLKTGAMIPYFWQSGHNRFESQWSDWSSYLYPASQITCDETYYYALIKNTDAFNIQDSQIVSYHDYLDIQDESKSYDKTHSSV